MSRPVTRSKSSPRALNMTTPTCTPRTRNSPHRFRPLPSGSARSSTITSNASLASFAAAAALQVPTALTSNPLRVRYSASIARNLASSSTTSTRILGWLDAGSSRAPSLARDPLVRCAAVTHGYTLTVSAPSPHSFQHALPNSACHDGREGAPCNETLIDAQPCCRVWRLCFRSPPGGGERAATTADRARRTRSPQWMTPPKPRSSPERLQGARASRSSTATAMGL